MASLMGLALLLLLFFKRKWAITTTTIASLLVLVGIWLERFTIIVPTLAKETPTGAKLALYSPTWVEWAITAGGAAGFILFVMLFAKFFPIVSIWEVKEGNDYVAAKGSE